MRKCDENRPYIFISYSHRDSKKVIEIIEKMSEQGYNIWYDEGIDPGTEWDENIAKHVKECAYFIAFVSSGYVGSKNCKDELNYSRDLDKNQFIVYLEDVQLPDGMAMRMNRIQSVFWYKYNFTNIDDAYEKLYSAEGIDNTKLYATDNDAVADSSDESIASELTGNKVAREKKNILKKLPKWVLPVAGAVLVAIIALVIVFTINNSSMNKQVLKGIDMLHAANGESYDPEGALAIFETEAQKGDEDATYLAAYTMFSLLSNTIKCDYAKVLQYCESISDTNPYAKLELAYLYDEAYGVARDKQKAEELYSEAYSEIDTAALINSSLEYRAEELEQVGNFYYNGYGCDVDYKRAKELFDISAELGSLKAEYYIAVCYINGKSVDKDYDKALNILKTLSDKGMGSADGAIGYIYYYGDVDAGVAQNYELAKKYYEKSADAGYATGMSYLSNMYKLGRGVEQDINKAISLLEESFKNGRRKSAYDIGDIYYIGTYVEKDYAKAIEWYEKAYEKGEIDNVYWRARIYDKGGYGVNADKDKAIELLKLAEELESSDALNSLGVAYEKGDGVEQSYETALDYYKRAADKGNSIAMSNLGKKYRYGIEGYMEPDFDQAIYWYKKAAENDDADAMYSIACMYDEEGDNQNLELYIKWLEQAASYGNSSALNDLGVAYEKGEGVEQSYEKALDYFRQAADKGSSMAMRNLGCKYRDGIEGYLEPDFDQAGEWFAKAAEKGDTKSLYYFARMYSSRDNKDDKLAFELYKKAADAGYEDAYEEVAYRYYFGVGTEEDKKLAYEWYCKTEEAGKLSAYGMGHMCRFYYDGTGGVNQDYDKAFEYAKKGAEGGDKYSENLLASCYRHGHGTEQDYEKALEWYEKSAEHNVNHSMYMMGWMYEHGEGVNQDLDKAIEWYQKAVDAGYEGAEDDLKRVKKAKKKS